ncbi:MAG: thiamine phosphate synthase [Mesorhizobium sp.]
MSEPSSNHCRLVLVAGPGIDGASPARVVAALGGGDVASVILVQGSAGEGEFQSYCEAIVPAAQQAGAAVVVAGDSRIAGRAGADGIHIDGKPETVAEAVERHSGKLIVGAGGVKTRHEALELGEAQPDYVFFGRFGFDQEPAAHPRNLDLAAWWSPMVEIPCIVQAGSEIAGIEACAQTGAEFVALSAAIFGNGADPADAVAKANALLDERAPKFEAQ